MTLQSTPLRAFPTQARIQKVLSLVEEFSSSREQPLSLWWSLLGVMSSMSALVLGSCFRMRSLQLRLNVAGPQPAEHTLISWDDLSPGSSVVVRRQPSRRGCPSRSPSTAFPSLYGHARLRLGGFIRRRPVVRLVDSGHLPLFDQPPRTVGGSVGCPGVPPPPERSLGVPVHGQHLRSGLHAQGRGYSFCHPQLSSAGYPSPLRGERCMSAPPICAGEAQRSGGFSQSGLTGLGLRVDPLPGGLQGDIPSLAGHHRPLRNQHESPFSGVFLPYSGSSVCGDRRHAPEVGRLPGVCVPAFRLHPQCPRQGSPVLEPRGHVGGSVLATEAVVSGSFGAPS